MVDHSNIVLPDDQVYQFMPSRGPGGCKFIADESAGMWPIGFQGDANTNWQELRDEVWGRNDIDEWWDYCNGTTTEKFRIRALMAEEKDHPGILTQEHVMMIGTKERLVLGPL